MLSASGVPAPSDAKLFSNSSPATNDAAASSSLRSSSLVTRSFDPPRAPFLYRCRRRFFSRSRKLARVIGFLPQIPKAVTLCGNHHRRLSAQIASEEHKICSVSLHLSAQATHPSPGLPWVNGVNCPSHEALPDARVLDDLQVKRVNLGVLTSCNPAANPLKRYCCHGMWKTACILGV